MKKITMVILTMGIVMGAGKIGEAVVPPSTSLTAKVGRSGLVDVIEKLERHEEENINFLRSIMTELKDLKNGGS